MITEGLLATAIFQTASFSILLVLFFLLLRDLPARFLRLWAAGWAALTVSSGIWIVHLWGGGNLQRILTAETYLAGILLLLAAVLDYIGQGRSLSYIWPVGLLCEVVVGAAQRSPSTSGLLHWVSSSLVTGLLLCAGWILWRRVQKQSGFGSRLLAAALLLAGLHRLDRVLWPGHPLYLQRAAFQAFLEICVGMAMAVLVLDLGRMRTEDLNDKLRRLTLITTASTQSFNVDQVLGVVLHHLVESVNASHGMVRLLSGQGEIADLAVRAAVGFSPEYLTREERVSPRDPWMRKVLSLEQVFSDRDAECDPEVRRRMNLENLSALVMVRLPGQDSALGVLAVGSTTRRRFRADEISFLVNVANLLGLTVQNVRLFEQADRAHRQWASTFDAIADPIVVHDSEGRILRVNQAFARRAGLSTETLVDQSVADVLRRGDSEWEMCPYCEGAGGKGEEIDPGLGGYLLACTSNFNEPKDAQVGTIHVLQDITERRRAEEKYRTLIENVQEGVFISTPEGQFLHFNVAFMRMLGYDNREELLAVQDIAAVLYVNASDRERLKKLLRDHGAVTDFEFQMRRKDGEIRTFLESSFITRDSAGTVAAYQGFVLDITERKQAEQEIRRRNRELMVLNAIGQTLNLPYDLHEMLTRALRQVVELFGVDQGAIYLLDAETSVLRRAASFGMRSEYARHFPPTAIPSNLIDHMRAARATVFSRQSLPLPSVFRDIQEKEELAVSYTVILRSTDRLIGKLGLGHRSEREFAAAELNLLTSIGNQISAAIERLQLYEETRQAYESLRRTQEQLLQSEKMVAVGQLISGVAHELNNPLTAILGYGQLLASSDVVSPRGAEYLDKLYKQAQRTHRIVHNLLSFARQQKPERSSVGVNQILEDTLSLREYDLRLNNIVIHHEFQEDLPMTPADPHQLQQVFLNILNNAVDAILERSDQGEIWIRTGVENDRIVIEFTDSGPGVRDVMRVFDPFYTTKPVGKGTGLGLSICYGIISEHGGEITVRNGPSRGACFTIRLPLLPVTDNAEAHPDAPLNPSVQGRVLLVDDEEAVLDLEREILEGRCRSVRTARTGAEALRVLEEELVDLVVTDMKMPGEITGRELYRWIRKHRPELSSRVIFTISDARAEEAIRTLAESGCQYLQKPFRVDQFLTVVQRALAQSEPSVVKR